MFTSLDISASGLYAQRIRMDTTANNVANVNTTRDENGNPKPYLRKDVIFKVGGVGKKGELGVEVPEVVEDPKAVHYVYDPTHPDRVMDGDMKNYVLMPNINGVEEMVNLIAATRGYEANVTVMDASKAMMNTALRIIA